MSSYHSIAGSFRRHLAATDGSNDHNVNESSSLRPPNERTSLLTVTGSPYLRGIAGVSIEQQSLRDDATDILDDDDENFPVLSKATSNTPLGIEAEVIPALGNSPGEFGDYRLPPDDELRLRTVKEDIEEDSQCSQISFHGGISKRSFWVIFSAILIANFVAAFDSTVMASTHTSITSAFKASNSASWLSTSFLLTSTSFQPLYGRVSDVLGRKIPFIFGCVVFTVATAWCGLADSIWSFIAARAVCGIGAGGMLTMGAIVLSDMLPIEIRGTYQSVNNLAYGLGSALGAATGGFLADTLGWRWEFGIQVPFGLFCIAVCAVTIPNPEHLGENLNLDRWQRFRSFDLAGSFFLTTSVAFLILGMSLGGNVLEWADWRVIGSLVLGLFLSILLIRTEKKAISPVMPLHFLWGSQCARLVMSNALGTMTVSTILFNIPLFFQAVLLESATKAGSRLLIPSVAGTVASVSTGLIITRWGRIDPTLYLGCIFLAVGAILFCFLDRRFPEWAFFIFLIPSNLGLGFALPSSLMSVLATSSQQEQAVATSTLVMWRSLGSVMGVASSSLIVQNCLYHFLEIFVKGPQKDDVILLVREKVTAIHELSAPYQDQVITAYAASLRYCFIWASVTSILSFALVIGIKLPSLRTRESYNRIKESLVAGE